MVGALALCALVAGGCPRRREGALPFGAASADCGACHDEHAAALEASAHGRATTSPVFTALVARAGEAWGEAARERCVRCHAPEHVPAEDGMPAEPGIACVSCHAAAGNRGTADGALVLDLGAPLDGPFADAEPTPAHASRARGLVSDSTLCLTCHEVTGPALFVETTAAEHAEAVRRVGAPPCLTCHLPPREPGPIAAGASLDRPRRAHSFVGPRPPDALDPASLTLYEADLRELFGHDRVRLEVALAPADGETPAVARVVLTNAGMGHALPTGVAFLRELRVDVELVDGDGRTETRRAALVLGDVPTRAGEPVALVTDADAIERRRVEPGEAAEVALELGAAVREVRARLVLRAYREEVLAALGLDGRTAPEVVVLEAAARR